MLTRACALVIVLLVASVGCAKKACDDDETYCMDNTAYACVAFGGDGAATGTNLVPTPCGAPLVCVVPADGNAFCAASAEPGVCAGVTGGVRCDATNAPNACSNGFPIDVGSACGSGLCQQDVRGCLGLPGPQAECAARTPPANQVVHFCGSDTLYACDAGYALAGTACGSGLCDDTGSDAACVVSTTPDPRCDPSARPPGITYFPGYAYSYCSPSPPTVISCIDDLFSAETTCGPEHPECTNLDSEAVCSGGSGG